MVLYFCMVNTKMVYRAIRRIQYLCLLLPNTDTG